MSPRTAKRLGVNAKAFDAYGNGAFVEGDYTESDVVEIEIPGGRKIKGPVLVSPGHADDSVSIALGYGRRRTGRVGAQHGLRRLSAAHGQNDLFRHGAKVTPVGRRTYQLVITQQHQAMEGRNLVRELPIETYKQNAGFNYKEGKRSSWR